MSTKPWSWRFCPGLDHRRWGRLLELGPRVPDQSGPFRGFDRNEGGEVLRRADLRLCAEPREVRADLGRPKGIVDGGVELADDGCRRARGGEYAGPGCGWKSAVPVFEHRRHIRQCG